MKKSLKDTDYSDITRTTYRVLSYKFGYTARISDLWNLLRMSYGLKEFEILEHNNPEMRNFESYLIDQYIDWVGGKEIEFDNIEEAIFGVGDFTGMEKLLLQSGDLQDRLWAIFLCLSDPNLKI